MTITQHRTELSFEAIIKELDNIKKQLRATEASREALVGALARHRMEEIEEKGLPVNAKGFDEICEEINKDYPIVIKVK